MVLCGISTCFQVLSPSKGQVVHALLTRSPLVMFNTNYSRPSVSPAWGPTSLLRNDGRCLEIIGVKHNPFDLHVLGTPPAFVLSQDQTLEFDSISFGVSTVRCSLTFRLVVSIILRFLLSSFTESV